MTHDFPQRRDRHRADRSPRPPCRNSDHRRGQLQAASCRGAAQVLTPSRLLTAPVHFHAVLHDRRQHGNTFSEHSVSHARAQSPFSDNINARQRRYYCGGRWWAFFRERASRAAGNVSKTTSTVTAMAAQIMIEGPLISGSSCGCGVAIFFLHRRVDCHLPPRW
jgi:hypothetical protein